MTDNELLLAISEMINKKLKSELAPLKSELQETKQELHQMKRCQENMILPQLDTIKSELAELAPLKSELQETKQELHQLKLYQENIILPRLDTIESCYTDTYKRYKNYADKMDAFFDDIAVMKKVIQEHSETLQKIS